MENNYKNKIRKQAIDIRNKLDKNQVVLQSEIIAAKLNQLDLIKNAKSIMCYVSFENEVETHTLISDWIGSGKQVSVPYVVNARTPARFMHAISISDLKELEEGTFGVLEPLFKENNIVDPSTIDAVIVPGSAFDINKNRIGYGAGYYDMFLKKTSGRCSKIGICYDFQIYESIPFEEYDVPLDMLVSEKRIIK